MGTRAGRHKDGLQLNAWSWDTQCCQAHAAAAAGTRCWCSPANGGPTVQPSTSLQPLRVPPCCHPAGCAQHCTATTPHQAQMPCPDPQHIPGNAPQGSAVVLKAVVVGQLMLMLPYLRAATAASNASACCCCVSGWMNMLHVDTRAHDRRTHSQHTSTGQDRLVGLAAPACLEATDNSQTQSALSFATEPSLPDSRNQTTSSSLGAAAGRRTLLPVFPSTCCWQSPPPAA